MNEQSKSFLKTWVLVGIVVSTVLAVFNAIMDPYLVLGMPRITGLNSRKPGVETQQRLMKAYDVVRSMPNTIILGGSRAGVGLDAQAFLWPEHDRPVYNLSIGGGGPYVSYRYLQHVISQRQLGLVVLGLEFEFFARYDLLNGSKAGTEFESYLAVSSDGNPSGSRNWQHIRSLLQATLTLGALTDSVGTLAANFSGDSSDIIAGNWISGPFRQASALMGSYPIFTGWDYDDMRVSWDTQSVPLVMQYVRAILDLCDSHGVRVIVFISPTHADGLEILDLLGHWQAFEDWEHQLAAVVANYQSPDGHKRIPLWDFTGYDAYSTENVTANGHVLHWFWDPAHYTTALGDRILKRIFDGAASDFGVALSVETVEAHLSVIREQRHLYRQRNQADVRRVHDLYDLVLRMKSPTVAHTQ